MTGESMRRRIKGRSLSVVLVVATVACGILGWAQAEARQWANEYELKAAFVYRLMSFVEWPGDVLGDHLTVGFVGEGPMGDALTRSLQGKRIGSRPIEVRVVRTTGDMRDCNVLVVSYSDASRTRQAVAGIKDASVLTIGDGEGFARMGGVVALVPREGTFQLAINPQAAARARIKISSKLLTMAKLLSSEETP